MRACEARTYEPATCWRRWQPARHEFFFEDLDGLRQDRHRQFLEALMNSERQCFLNVGPSERSEGRVDQANGFYERSLTPRRGVLPWRVPRTRSGRFHPQGLPRSQRREGVIPQALPAVFRLGVSTRQTAQALATRVEVAVSAATVSAVAKARDGAGLSFHRRRWADPYRDLILDGVSVPLRWVDKVQRRRVLCAYGLPLEGQRQLVDFQSVKAQGQETWDGFWWPWGSRGLHGEFLELIAPDGQPGWIQAVGRTSCATWTTHSKPPSVPAWRQPNVSTQPNTAPRRSGGCGSGNAVGRSKPPKPGPAWKRTGKNCWPFSTVRPRRGNGCARPRGWNGCA
jgi:transposase-like protein